MNEKARELALVDELQNWGEKISNITGQERRDLFDVATPLWLERMISEGKLLLNPRVIDELRSLQWKPSETHKKMIWASIICRIEDKAEKARIRKLIQAKYDNDWWEEVYARAGKAWPAWDRYRKNILSAGSGTLKLAAHSSVLGLAMQDEYKAILEMVPAA